MKVRRLLLVLFVLLIAGLVAYAQDSMSTINVGGNDELGSFLVDANGMTLYIYTIDPLGETKCYDRCAENWPPLIVTSADDLTVADGIPGVFGTVERTNGDLQVTYNGLPLYLWVHDNEPGDSTGQAVGNVWWVVAPGSLYVQHNADLGHILVGTEGMTVYLFKNDEMDSGASNCYDQCAENWPPLTVDSEDVVSDPRLPGEVGTIERTDGSLQVTYNGWPLYYFKSDMAPGDATGEGKGDVWYTISPETVMVSQSDDLGTFLVDPAGRTLYMFTKDEAGVSNCTDTCLDNWPVFKHFAGDRLVNGAGIEGELGTIERDNNVLQVTYNGMPLYYWKDDMAPGDTGGQGKGDVWFVVEP